MAKAVRAAAAAATPLPFSLASLLLLLLLSAPIGDFHFLPISVNAQTQLQNANDGQRTWCVAKPSSDEATLLANINYACSNSKVDCSILQKGCPCYYPYNLMNHASIAMNLYYHSYGENQWNCDFRGSALIVITDPSYANCIYP